MTENVTAQIVDDILPDNAHVLDLHAQSQSGIQRDQKGQAAVKPEALYAALGNGFVHDPLKENGYQHGKRGRGEHQRYHDPHALPVGFYVSGKTF